MHLAVLSLLAVLRAAAPQGYDPLRASAAAPATYEASVHDTSREREIPVRVYLPEATGPAPVILYSHGLGGSRETAAFLGAHWARRGYVAVFMQHPGSDAAVWQGKPPREALRALEKAANVRNFVARARDVPAVLDALQVWNATAGHPLMGRMDLSRVGMSGHSFGALTTQAVSGQAMPFGRDFSDPRIRAAVVMSPSPPKHGDAAKAFAKVRIPWLLMTGTKDASPIGDATPENRLRVFPALPAGHKYQVVLDGAEHSVFTDRALPQDSAPRNPKHHPAIAAISTAFWDAYLRGDADAAAWLEQGGARALLAPTDRWDTK